MSPRCARLSLRLVLTALLLGAAAGCAPVPAHAGEWGPRYERVVRGNELLIIDRYTGYVVERRWIEPPPVIYAPPRVIIEEHRGPPPYHHHHRDRW